MKKLIFPVVLVLTATGTAFATANAEKSTTVTGYRIDGSGSCVDTFQPCSTVHNDACLWEGDDSTELEKFPLSATMCGGELYKL